MKFPFAGTTRFEGMEELPQLLCDPRALRDGYIEALEEYLVEVRRGCTRLGIDYQLVRTGDYLDAVLSQVPAPPHGRSRRRRRRGACGRNDQDSDERRGVSPPWARRTDAAPTRSLDKVTAHGILRSIPWYMAAGGALVSSPILIHLINRMRFKRIRWAAMEFLLKSQKRNRRRLIIEQLILLLLRILLVLLAGFLLGRLRLGGDTGQNAIHFVVLDDTPSMGDHFVDNGKASNSFEVAKEQVKLLADTIAQASTRQQMRVVLLSDLDNVVFDQQLGAGSSDEVAAKLQDLQAGVAAHRPHRSGRESPERLLDAAARQEGLALRQRLPRPRLEDRAGRGNAGQGRGRPDGDWSPRQLHRHGPPLPRPVRGGHRPARQPRRRGPQGRDHHRRRGRAGRVHRRHPQLRRRGQEELPARLHPADLRPRRQDRGRREAPGRRRRHRADREPPAGQPHREEVHSAVPEETAVGRREGGRQAGGARPQAAGRRRVRAGQRPHRRRAERHGP